MEAKGRSGWQSNLLLTAGTMATVFLALILAQLDALQGRGEPGRPGLPIVNIQATAVAVGGIIPLDEVAAALPVATVAAAAPVPEDGNPRPEFITSVNEEGVIFTVCGEVPSGWLLYTTQPGESLASLAAATQSTAAELAAANCLTDGQPLTVGMQLLVPRQPAASLCGPPQWWVRYQVRAGDTLGALAATRGTTVDEILRANCRESLDLLAGQLIFLPPGFPSGGAAPLPQPSLTPLPPTAVPTLAPLPTTGPGQPPATQPPRPTSVPPSPTVPVVVSPPRPTVTPPVPPTGAPTTAPTVPPTSPPPTQPPPTVRPPTATPPPPTATTPPTLPPPTATPPPTEPPPTEPPPTEPPPTEPPPTEPPPTEPPPTEPPPTEEAPPAPTDIPITPEPPDDGG